MLFYQFKMILIQQPKLTKSELRLENVRELSKFIEIYVK